MNNEFSEYALSELAYARKTEDANSELHDKTDHDVLELIALIDRQDNEIYNIRAINYMINRIVNFLPLTPLTGEDDEWNEIADNLYQNRRCASVFKDEDGPHFIDGYVFEDEDGRKYYSRDSVIKIEFPFDVPEGPTLISYKDLAEWSKNGGKDRKYQNET